MINKKFYVTSNSQIRTLTLVVIEIRRLTILRGVWWQFSALYIPCSAKALLYLYPAHMTDLPSLIRSLTVTAYMFAPASAADCSNA